MTGISDNNSVPSIFSSFLFQPTEEGGSEPASNLTQLDRFLDEEGTPLFLNLQAQRNIGSFPPGRLSLIQLTQLISSLISQLKDALHNSEFMDDEVTRLYHLAALDTANDIIDQWGLVQAKVEVWNGELRPQGEALDAKHTEIREHEEEITTLLEETTANDNQAIDNVNEYIDIYNNPTEFANFANSNFGGDQNAALNFINGKITEYNNYMSERPDIQQELDEYGQAVDEYNDIVDETNTALESVNDDRAESGLSQIPDVEHLDVPNTNVHHYLPQEGEMPSSLPTVSLPAGSTNIDRINTTPTVSNVPTPSPDPDIPRVPIAEAFRVLWLPFALPNLFYLSSFNRLVDLSEALRATNELFYRSMGFNILLPDAYIQRAQQVFLDSLTVLGGAGLAAFAMGLHSRNLEIALSSGIYRSLAMNAAMPITGRLFGRLQFTALELLQNSSLLSSLPAMRFIASQLGYLASSSPAISVAISLAITEQVLGLVAGGVINQLVNAQMNRLPFFARMEASLALNEAVNAERNLRFAIASGNPGMIHDSLAMLGNARMRLANATTLLNTFGFLSIGGVASFSQAVSATMSLSILSVALAHFGRTIGMPNLIGQMFANLSGMPISAALIAMTAGSRILDVLDNPFSVLALKQTLVDTLVYGRGFNSVVAGLMINSAVDNIILRGGIQTFSYLQSQLATEFQAAGFNFFQAHMLANETAALIRGDMGVAFINAAFGLNYDRSIVASSIINNITGIDIGVAGAMMSSAITRSLLMGGFGSSVRLQNELTALFQSLGMNFIDASLIAQNMANFIATVGTVIPLTQYPGVTSLLLGNEMLAAIAFGSVQTRDELRNRFQAQGLDYFQADFLANQLLSLAAQTYTTPGNLFEIALEAAIGRAGTSFQTQREFRDTIFNELKGVGFSWNDAMFLANAVAAYGLDGTLLPLYGASVALMSSIEGATVNRIATDLGIPVAQAQAIYDQAESQTLLQGPYSSPDQFQSVLKAAIFSSILLNTGRGDGNVLFDRAMADLSDPSHILGLAALTEQISNSVLGLLRPDLGSRLAQEIKDQILLGLLGGTTVDEIEDTERRNPLSVLNQLDDALGRILRSEEEEDFNTTLRKLIQLLQALMTPNAEMGFLLQTLSQGPSTIVGSTLGQPHQPITSIPA